MKNPTQYLLLFLQNLKALHLLEEPNGKWIMKKQRCQWSHMMRCAYLKIKPFITGQRKVIKLHWTMVKTKDNSNYGWFKMKWLNCMMSLITTTKMCFATADQASISSMWEKQQARFMKLSCFLNILHLELLQSFSDALTSNVLFSTLDFIEMGSLRSHHFTS